MDKVSEEMYRKRFREENTRTAYMKFYSTLDEAADEFVKLYSPDGEYHAAGIWKTPGTSRYTIVKSKDGQAALDFGFKLIIDYGYARDVKAGRIGKREYPNDCKGYNGMDGSKTYIYEMYKELGLL